MYNNASPILGGCFDLAGVYVAIISGEGGKDSDLFCCQLTRAYYAYAARQGWELEESEVSERKLSFIAPPSALRFFRGEVGQHCIQRVPETERSGRRHTSLVSVIALPIHKIPANNNVLKDVEQIFQRGHGKGGQAQNTTDSMVKLRCTRTNLTVTINGRSRIRNLELARQILTERILNSDSASHQQTIDIQRQAQYVDGSGRGGRGFKKRTYNLIEDRVTDHITGNKVQCARRLLKEGCFEVLK